MTYSNTLTELLLVTHTDTSLTNHVTISLALFQCPLCLILTAHSKNMSAISFNKEAVNLKIYVTSSLAMVLLWPFLWTCNDLSSTLDNFEIVEIVEIVKKRTDYHRVNKAVPLRMAQSWPWGSQIAVKKKILRITCFSVVLGFAMTISADKASAFIDCCSRSFGNSDSCNSWILSCVLNFSLSFLFC